MKTIKVLMILSLIALLYSCSKDSNPADEGDTTSENAAARYYPGEVGSQFTYSFAGLSKTAEPLQAGLRVVTFTGMGTKNSTPYYQQRNVNYLGIDSTVNIGFFRRTETGVYFYVDTTGLSALIPDSVKNLIKLTADQEAMIFKKDFSDNTAWSAYKINILIANTIPVKVIDVQAKHVSTESLTLNLSSGNQTVQAEKFQYDLVYSMPDLVTYQTHTSVFTAYIWYSKNIGIVKMEGNTTVLQALSGNNVDFADTTKVMSQTLSDFKIK